VGGYQRFGGTTTSTLSVEMSELESGPPDPASSAPSQALIGTPNLHHPFLLPTAIITGHFLNFAHFYPEDGDSMLLRNVGTNIQDYTMS
jgi:hypothetical protein